MHPFLKSGSDEESHTGRNVAIGAAAAAPFAGLIGQKPIIHDPLQGAKGTKFKSWQEVSRAAQPGDMLLTNKSTEGPFKKFVTPLAGSEFYHSQPVMGRVKGHGVTADIGEIDAHRKSTSSMLRQTRPVHHMRGDYSDVVLLRPNRPLTGKQLETFQHEALRRARLDPGYDASRALRVWAHEIFVPKIPGMTGEGPQLATPGREQYQKIDKKTFKAIGKIKPSTICSGNVCSTAPAQALHSATSRRVVPGKAAQDVFPTDFLRSDAYKLIGSHTPDKHINTKWLKASPYLFRGGVGVLGAAGIYGASESPVTVGTGGGILAASLLASKINRSTAPSNTAAQLRLPSLEDVVASRLRHATLRKEVGKKGANILLRRWLSRRLPLLAAGGLAGGYAIKKLNEHNAT